ncbi:RNA polymerase sigma factor [Aeoliella sp. SH292]|uniref:RNA polymerase sigma factor n=1 Tax=Aeoliella sp. SH292 TaxID=3454464 RepID=UPI003F949391
MAETPQVELASLSDRALVRKFAQASDAEAFRELVTRHGPLVLSTCRRGLNSHADADDAFQATFLVLARSASKIRQRESIAAWLYGVATRITARMRRDGARRSTQMLIDTPAHDIDPLDELLARHDGTVADEELNTLPDKLRLPLVLRYLAGKSNTETAEELGISVATLEGRLKRGKQRLRVQLLRRGVSLVAIVAVLKSSRVVAGEVPGELLSSTVELALTGGSATTLALASEPTSSTHIALQELTTMNAIVVSKPLIATFALAGVLATIVTTQVAFSQAGGSDTVGNPFQLEAVATTALEEAAGEATIERAPASTAENSAATTTVAAEESQSNPFAGGLGGGIPTGGGGAIGGSGGFGVASATQENLPAEERNTSEKIPGIVDLKPRTESEIAIERALTQPLNSAGLEFQDTPLAEVVEFLKSDYNIEMQIDLTSLQDAGVSPDDPVSTNLHNIHFESALNLLLAPLHLTYVVQDEVLLIVSEEEQAERMEVRVYPRVAGSDASLELITKVVSPNSWEEHGGAGLIVSTPDRLIVRNTYRVHREINELLSQLMLEASATGASGGATNLRTH